MAGSPRSGRGGAGSEAAGRGGCGSNWDSLPAPVFFSQERTPSGMMVSWDPRTGLEGTSKKELPTRVPCQALIWALS